MDKINAEFEQKLVKCHHPGNTICLSEAVSTKASQLKAAGERLRLCNTGFRREAPRPELGPSGPAAAPTIPPAGNEEFNSSEQAGGCCPTQECQAERYRELERQRYEFAKRCVENRTSPCNVQPELIVPPLCEASKKGDQTTGGSKAIGQAAVPPEPEPKPRVLKGKPDPNDPQLKWKKTFGLDPDKWITLPEWMPVLEGGEQQIKNLLLTKKDGRILGFPHSFHDSWGNLWQLDRSTVKWEYIRGNIQQGTAIGQYTETKSGQRVLKNGLWLNPSSSQQ